MATKQIPFRPKLEGDFKNRFYQVVSVITSETPSEDIIRLAEEEIQWAENCHYNLDQRVKYRAVWYLLKDLINARYNAEYKNGALYMDMPTLTSNLASFFFQGTTISYPDSHHLLKILVIQSWVTSFVAV